MASLVSILFFSALINKGYSQLAATITNSSGEYYLSAGDGLFQWETITCGVATNCFIQCDSANACYGLTIEGALANNLWISCTDTTACSGLVLETSTNDNSIYCNEYQSCQSMVINGNSASSLSLECNGQQGCYQAIVNAEDASDVTLECNATTTTSTTYASCYQLKLYANNVNYPTIRCANYNCYYSEFYINNAVQGIISFSGQYGGYYANISAQYVTGGLIIDSDGPSASYGTKIYGTSMTSDISLECRGTYSCQYFAIYAEDINGVIDIQCFDTQSCYYLDVAANNAKRGLNIKCYGSSSCNYADIYCPEHSDCDIDCSIGAPSACQYTKIYVASQLAKQLVLDCSTDSTACSYVDIICRDTAGSTNWLWDATNSYWKCSDYGCCPIKEGNITCATGSSCQIDCKNEVGGCNNKYIDGSQASSLAIDCSTSGGTGSGCQGSLIFTPISSYTSFAINCTESNSCQYAYITTANDTAMDSFSVECRGNYACQSLSMVLQSTSITNLDIFCGTTTSSTYGSCRYSSLILQSSVGSFNLECENNACYDLDYTLDSPSIGTFTWNCGYYGCYSASLVYSNNGRIIATDAPAAIDSFVLSCTDTYACYSMYLQFYSVIVNDFHLTCSTTADVCNSFNVDVKIANSFNIDCIKSDSCQYASMNFTGVSDDVSGDIQCYDPSSTTSSSYGACYYADFYFSGYFNEDNGYAKNNNLTTYCGSYDCYGSEWWLNNNGLVDVNCNNPYSCYDANFYTGTADQFDLNCGNTYSCYSVMVQCPYTTIEACNIGCASSDYSCYDLNIQVPDSYIYGYLDLTCPSAEFVTNPCYSLDVTCTDYVKSGATYTYNYTSHQYECSYADLNYCCPYFKGASITCDEDGDSQGNCDINCNDGDCQGALIDGSSSDYLDVDCSSDYACQYSLIFCPVGGCKVNCDGYYACYGLQVTYSGVLTDEATVEVECDGDSYDYPCTYLQVNADYASEVEIKIKEYSQYFIINAGYSNTVTISCNNGKSDYDYTCYSGTINALSADTVNIECSNYYGCYYNTFYVSNANRVSLNAKGEYAFYSNYMHSYYANSFVANCSSDEYDMACYSSYWYIPSNAIFNCYGTGCESLGQLWFMENATDLQLNVNACDQCNDVEDCVQSMTIYCYNAATSSSYTYQYETWSQYDSDSDGSVCDTYDYQWDSTTVPDNVCGCYDVLANSDYTDDDSDDMCYSTSFSLPASTIVYIVLGVVGGIVLLCIFIVCACRSASKKSVYTPYVAPVTVSKPTPTVITQPKPRILYVTPQQQRVMVAPQQNNLPVVFTKSMNNNYSAQPIPTAANTGYHQKTASTGSGYAPTNIAMTTVHPSAPSDGGNSFNPNINSGGGDIPSAPPPAYEDPDALPSYNDVMDQPPSAAYSTPNPDQPGYDRFVSAEGGAKNVTNM